MNNLILFLNSFLSYGVMFLFIAALCTVSVFAGIKMRKNKNLKDAAAAGQQNS